MSVPPRLLAAVVLGVAAGALVAESSSRREARPRCRALASGPESSRRRRGREGAARLGGRVAPCVRPLVSVAGGLLERRARARTTARVARELPVALDLLAVAVGAGCTPPQAVATVARWAPGEIRAVFARVGAAAGRGSSFADAVLRHVAQAAGLGPLAEALVASDRLGTPLTPALERLAAAARADLRRHAEAQARAMPVKLLFPLVFLVLPAFALLTVVPAVVNALGRL